MHMVDTSQQFSLNEADGYLHLKTWGKLRVDDLSAPTDAALKLSKERNILKLLDDIREVDVSLLNIPMQTKSMGILWKLRAFHKVAVVMNSGAMHKLFAAAIEALHLNTSEAVFKSFDNEQDAIAWLKLD